MHEVVCSMFFIGIDIGKRHHEAGLINDKGDHVGNTIRFANSKDGSQKLLQFINQYKLTPDNSVVGLEATGHYWLSVFSFPHKLGFKTTVFNPLQSHALRQFYIRKTKTDVRDAYLIVQVIRIDSPDATRYLRDVLLEITPLARLRISFVAQ